MSTIALNCRHFIAHPVFWSSGCSINLWKSVEFYLVWLQETKCPVPFCLNIKHKLKQQQLQQRLQQAQLLRRRMAVMNTRSTVPSGALPGNSTTGGPGGVLAGGTVGQTGVMSGQPGAGNMVSLQTPHQPVGSKPGTQTPPANVLQVVKQVSQE